MNCLAKNPLCRIPPCDWCCDTCGVVVCCSVVDSCLSCKKSVLCGGPVVRFLVITILLTSAPVVLITLLMVVAKLQDAGYPGAISGGFVALVLCYLYFKVYQYRQTNHLKDSLSETLHKVGHEMHLPEDHDEGLHYHQPSKVHLMGGLPSKPTFVDPAVNRSASQSSSSSVDDLLQVAPDQGSHQHLRSAPVNMPREGGVSNTSFTQQPRTPSAEHLHVPHRESVVLQGRRKSSESIHVIQGESYHSGAHRSSGEHHNVRLHRESVSPSKRDPRTSMIHHAPQPQQHAHHGFHKEVSSDSEDEIIVHKKNPSFADRPVGMEVLDSFHSDGDDKKNEFEEFFSRPHVPPVLVVDQAGGKTEHSNRVISPTSAQKPPSRRRRPSRRHNPEDTL